MDIAGDIVHDAKASQASAATAANANMIVPMYHKVIPLIRFYRHIHSLNATSMNVALHRPLTGSIPVEGGSARRADDRGLSLLARKLSRKVLL